MEVDGSGELPESRIPRVALFSDNAGGGSAQKPGISNPKALSPCDSIQPARDVLQRLRDMVRENLEKEKG